MKLTVIGGASVRTPRFIPSLIRRAQRLELDELWLMDIDEHKLALMGELSIELARQQQAPFKIILTSDAKAAIRDADHIITTIRPGMEKGRVLDEQIAFKHGILGQETTGAGGFAMAMRSIPAILAYCQMAAELAPRAWIYNFTNPAGLVAQGLHDAGIRNVVGICDSANGAQHAVSRFLRMPLTRLRHEVFGLNHLSWTRSVKLDVDENGQGGEEVLTSLLNNPQFIATSHMSMFHPLLIAHQGMFLNEYLHYFYHRDEALQALLAKPETRGEEVLRLTGELLERLEEVKPSQHPQEALRTYHELMNKRGATYMAHARGGEERQEEDFADDDEGYAGVALGCVEAIARNTVHYTGLNVPNNGTIAGLAEDDIVEVNCRVDGSDITPIPVGNIPEDQDVLIRTVKRYERLTAQAILNRSKSLAVEALATHPLIGSYPLASKLVEEYVSAHHAYVGEWN